MLIKEITPRSKKYLKYISNQPCLLCGAIAVAHHIESGGMGMKCSDFRTVPLCVMHHTAGDNSIHSIGRAPFEKMFSIDLNKEVIHYLEKFITEEKRWS